MNYSVDENPLEDYWSRERFSAKELARAFVEGWKRSEAHRDMEEPTKREVEDYGFDYAKAAVEEWKATQPEVDESTTPAVD